MNKPVKLSDIIDAIEMMTDEYSSYLNMILLISGMNTRVRH
jgi:TRAP-type mannitol/chloroaromatic compound transport system permease small subunit